MGVFTKLFSGTAENNEVKVSMEEYTTGGVVKEGSSTSSSSTALQES